MHTSHCVSPAPPAMSAIVPRVGDPASGSSDEELDHAGWDWASATVEHGTSVYVGALQILGIELAQAVPKKVRAEAITDLDVTPASDLIMGRFDKTPTKERLLRLSRIKLMLGSAIKTEKYGD